MEETSILETFRFDFTYRSRDSERLNKLFIKYGYPNLKVNLADDYDGYWQVYNTRTNQTVWNDYHSGFVTFFKDGQDIKIAFDHKHFERESLPEAEFRNSVYFEPNCKITTCDDEVDNVILKERIKSLESELEQYKKKEAQIIALLRA